MDFQLKYFFTFYVAAIMELVKNDSAAAHRKQTDSAYANGFTPVSLTIAGNLALLSLKCGSIWIRIQM
jgi:hypothetical protein